MLLRPRSASPTESYNSDDSFNSSIASQSDSEPGDIKDQILAALVESAVGNHKFLPADKLEALVTRDVVTAELKCIQTESEGAELDTNSLAFLVDYVLEKAKRVFLILAHNGNLENLPSLVHDGFTDSDLPIHKARDGPRRTAKLEKRRSSGLDKAKTKAKPAKSRYIVCSVDEASNRCKSRKWAAFSAWLDAEIELFNDVQWMCLSPIFTKDKFQYQFHPQRPLPFISKRSFSKSGFSSKVYQVKIHAAHHDEINDGQPLLVALKEMSPKMEDYYYEKEADTLASVRQLQHPHIIKPIATYQNGETNYFLFPWADGGNLQEFWQETDVPVNGRPAPRIYREPGFIFWVLEQIRGLSDGLRTLYDRNCRHGDLKPENILRLKRPDSPGVLLITDMGLAKFHIQAIRQRIERLDTGEAPFRYAPPEMSSNDPNVLLSRDYDVWSMGCILLEFLIWMLEGQPGLTEFYQFGNKGFHKFWEYKDDKYEVHNVVKSWIYKLSQQLGLEDESVDTALKRVLQLVEGKLLVVDLECNVPIGHTCRANASQLFHCVDEIYHRAKNDPGFLYDGGLWRKSKQSISVSLQLTNKNDIPHSLTRSLPRRPTDAENIDGPFSFTASTALDDSHNMPKTASISQQDTEGVNREAESTQTLIQNHGPRFDAELDDGYRGLSGTDEFESQSPLAFNADRTDDIARIIEPPTSSSDDHLSEDVLKIPREGLVDSEQASSCQVSSAHIPHKSNASNTNLPGDSHLPSPLRGGPVELKAEDHAVSQNLVRYTEGGPTTVCDTATTNDLAPVWDKAVSHNTSITHNTSIIDDTPVIKDTVTEYSNTSSTTSSKQETYIKELAVDMFSHIDWVKADEHTRDRVEKNLPELLKAFALKIGGGLPTRMHREITAFVHKRRIEITNAFTEVAREYEEEIFRRSDQDTMSIEEQMRLWFSHTDIEDDGRSEPEETDALNNVRVKDEQDNYLDQLSLQEAEEVHNSLIPEASEAGSDENFDYYQKFITGTEAYEWLLSRLRREFHLVPTESNTIQKIRNDLISSLPSVQRISRSAPSQRYKAKFELDWDIIGFFETQNYSRKAYEVLEGVITLTGSSQDAQATTCAQYMEQTWPLTGTMTIELIKTALQSDEASSHLIDGTTLRAWISRPKFTVEVYGIAASITETGEQLAWLGAALRTSPLETGLVYCKPTIDCAFQDSKQPQIQSVSADVNYKIGFSIEEIPLRLPLSSIKNQCWHNLFRNPVIVPGFPIRGRNEWNTGLEIPVNIMAGLAQTSHVDQFDKKTFIKGYSAMLVATKLQEDILCWHLVYNRDGSRISYLSNNDIDHEQYPILNPVYLTGYRHVLGWCRRAQSSAGSTKASYRITYSKAEMPYIGGALHGISISLGQVITGGPNFHIGAKDVPIQMTRDSYLSKLKWVSKRLVLLWDVDEKRGWLINGASALLHILRAYLAHYRDVCESELHPESGELHDFSGPLSSQSSLKVLLKSQNRKLRLYPDKDGFVLLESRVEHFYNVLEKLFDIQTQVSGYCGINLQDKPRSDLEGWDFTDLVTGSDPVNPRMVYLERAGKVWVDFIRAAHVVTLMGNHFGELIRPVADEELCSSWAQLPKKQHYIAAVYSDLEQHEIRARGQIRLSNNLIWHTSTTVFGSCQCKGGKMKHRDCDIVQTLFPVELSQELPSRTEEIQLNSSAAVIFGHNSNFLWAWEDTGHPQKISSIQATASLSAARADSVSPKDSGIGSSLPSSSFETRASLSRSDTQYSKRTRSKSPVYINYQEIRQRYSVGFICAMPKELKAVRMLLDKEHKSLLVERGETNQYVFGEMSGHNVVATCLPEYGTNNAATTANNMQRSFSSIRFYLLVGIGGGVPSETNQICLGDVVVSATRDESCGVIQYDFGKKESSKPVRLIKTTWKRPNVLSNAINVLLSKPSPLPNPLEPYLAEIGNQDPQYKRPDLERDAMSKNSCTTCESHRVCPEDCSHLEALDHCSIIKPTIHYGPIASGNQVVKDADFRDMLGLRYGVFCIEMEAAGLLSSLDNFLVIRGISDYCDGQKNNVWQKYAAATAASYAKFLLNSVAIENPRSE